MVFLLFVAFFLFSLLAASFLFFQSNISTAACILYIVCLCVCTSLAIVEQIACAPSENHNLIWLSEWESPLSKEEEEKKDDAVLCSSKKRSSVCVVM